ncbi:MAG: hypothetical protein Q8P75_03020 [bacterium]|nr:hypothetical protein [bacterium]MDZ4347898.1 hypothetical protein [Candidatus Binatia bacterium]
MAKAKSAPKSPAASKLPDIVTVKAVLLGISALLLNPATEALLESLRTRVPLQRDRTRSREEEAREKLLINDQGQYYIPMEYLLSSLIEAGRHVDFKPRTKISTKLSTLLYSFLFGYPEQLVLTDGAGGKPEWRADFRRGCNPADGVMVALVRPRFDNWGIEASFKVRTARINPNKVREIFEISGSMIGLGDFRPACRGPFGCFEVSKWELYGPDGELLSGEKVTATDGATETAEEAVAVPV